jgi:hypothetical protein
MIRKLLPVKDLLERQTSRHLIKRFTMYKADAGKIVWAREKVAQALSEFGVSVTIYLRERLSGK